MNIQGANLLSLLSGSAGLGNSQQGLLSTSGDQAGFAAALMNLLQGNPAGGGNPASPDLAEIQNWIETAAGGDAQQGLQSFAALFGQNLPAANKSNQDIDLKDTLQTLADVLNQLQQLETSPDGMSGLPATDQLGVDAAKQTVAADSQQAASDQQAAAADAVAAMSNAMPLPVQAETAGAVPDNGELSGAIPITAKATTTLAADAGKQSDRLDGAVAKTDDPSLDFNRSIGALLAKDGADGKPQQDKSLLDLKSENLAAQVDQQTESGEQNKLNNGIAADIAKLNNVVRSDTAAVPSPQPGMNKPFGDSAWNQELGEKLIWMHKQSIPSVELRLNPEHLGPVLVKIDVSHDQASVAFTAQHLAVKEALEAAIPKLREMLGGQQLNLADVNVSQQQSDQRQPAREFFQMASGQGRGHPTDADSLANGPVNEAQDIVDEIEAGRAVASHGLLSLFA